MVIRRTAMSAWDCRVSTCFNGTPSCFVGSLWQWRCQRQHSKTNNARRKTTCHVFANNVGSECSYMLRRCLTTSTTMITKTMMTAMITTATIADSSRPLPPPPELLASGSLVKSCCCDRSSHHVGQLPFMPSLARKHAWYKGVGSTLACRHAKSNEN